MRSTREIYQNFWREIGHGPGIISDHIRSISKQITMDYTSFCKVVNIMKFIVKPRTGTVNY